MLSSMAASQQGGPLRNQAGTQAEGSGQERNNKLEGLQLILKIKKEFVTRQKEKERREAVRQRARQDAEAEAEAEGPGTGGLGDEQAEAGQEVPQGGLANDDPEPQVFDDSILQAALFKPLNLSVLDLDELGVESSEVALAYGLLLEQGAVVAQQGGDRGLDPDLLRLLFDTVVRGEGALAALAASELLAHYERLGPVEEPRWVPTISDLYDALCTLGYRGVDAGSGAPSSSSKPNRRRSSANHADASPAPGAAAGVGDCRSPPSAMQLRNLKKLLVVVAGLCRLHRRRPAGMLDFSRDALAAGTKLMTALLELQLCRVATRVMLPELSAATGALMCAWGQPGVDCVDFPGAGTDDTVWDSLVGQVAGKVAKLGASDFARNYVLHNIPGTGERRKQLQCAIALQLMRSMLDKPAGSSKRAGGPEDTVRLLKDLAPRPEMLFKVVQVKGEDKPDYWRLISLVEAAHVVVWGTTYHDGEGVGPLGGSITASQAGTPAHQLAVEWSQLVKGMAGGLRSNSNPTATKLRALLSDIANRMDFGVMDR